MTAEETYSQSRRRAAVILKHKSNVIETLPLEKAPEPYARMMDGKARFRMVK